MAETLSPLEKKLVVLLSEGLPLEERPFLRWAERLGVSEEEVFSLIESLLKKKIIRRFGATVRHDLSGYQGNVMAAWIVPEERIEEIGKALAQKPFITHCYWRRTAPHWPYNLYTMIHAPDEETCRRLVEEISQEFALPHYELLFTQKEIVRRTRRYFEEEV